MSASGSKILLDTVTTFFFAVVQRHTQPARAPCWRLRPSSFIYDTVTTAGPISAISGSVEPFWPLDVGIPFGHPNFCGHCNFTTTGPIHAVSSFMEPSSWPLDVQWHGHCPIRLLQDFISGTGILTDALTLQPLALKCATAWRLACWALDTGSSHQASTFLWML